MPDHSSSKSRARTSACFFANAEGHAPACKSLNWTQGQVATAVEVGIVTVRHFEAEKSVPRVATVEVIASALEAAGVILVDENGEGLDVRLREGSLTGRSSRRLDRSWLVFESIENEHHDRRVDLFSRPDGSFGFESSVETSRIEASGRR